MTSKILKLWKDAFNNDNVTVANFNKTMTTDQCTSMSKLEIPTNVRYLMFWAANY